jgi:hypothetical protein
VQSGSGEPEELRARLRAALPRAPPPGAQAVRDPSVLHTTIARLLAPPRRPSARGSGGGGLGRPGAEVAAAVLGPEVARAAAEMTQELCGLSAVFDELWWALGWDRDAGGGQTFRVKG